MVPKYQDKCHELIDSISSTMKIEVERLYNSGMIDVDLFSIDEYALAKVLVTAAMHRLKDVYKPLDNNNLENFKNLLYF